MVPSLYGEEHVRSHQQPQLLLRVPLPEGTERADGVALPLLLKLLAPDLHRALRPGQGVSGQLGHMEAVLRGGGAVRQMLVGRQSGGDQVEPVQVQKLRRVLRRAHMA